MVIAKPGAVKEGKQQPWPATDTGDAPAGLLGKVVDGVGRVVGELLALRLAVKMPPGSFGEDGPGFGGGSDSEVG